MMAFTEGNNTRFITRNGNDYTNIFQDVVNFMIGWVNDREMVLDGEMTVTDESGKINFQALQNYMINPKGKKLIYMVFDLIALDGTDLRGQPLSKRKETLESLMKDTPNNLRYNRHVRGNGEESFKAACEAG